MFVETFLKFKSDFQKIFFFCKCCKIFKCFANFILINAKYFKIIKKTKLYFKDEKIFCLSSWLQIINTAIAKVQTSLITMVSYYENNPVDGSQKLLKVQISNKFSWRNKTLNIDIKVIKISRWKLTSVSANWTHKTFHLDNNRDDIANMSTKHICT